MTPETYMAPATRSFLDLKAAGADRRRALQAQIQSRGQLAERIADALGHGYTVSECARAAGVSRGTVYNLLEDLA